MKSDYNFGYEIADKLDFWIKFSLSKSSSNGKKTLNNTRKYFDPYKHLSLLKEIYPQRYYRLKGISDKINLNLYKLQEIIFNLRRKLNFLCTDSFCAPPATTDNEVYMSWNLDILLSAIWIRRLPLFIHSQPGSFRYVAFGAPCLLGLGLINQEGLSYVATAVGMKDGGGEGLLDFEINNLCMETCGDVNSVIEKYKVTPKYSFAGYGASIMMNLNSIWGDVKGNGVAIEHSKSYIHFQYQEDGLLAIANHHQFLDRKLTGSPDPNIQPAITGSYCRLGRMKTLLKFHKGKIDLQLMKRIVADHEIELEHIRNYNYEKPVDDATICCHYWNILNHIKKRKFILAYEAFLMGKTLMAFILQPRKFIVHRCIGNPCSNPFKKFDFKKALVDNSFDELKFFMRVSSSAHRRLFKMKIYKAILEFINEVFFRRLIIFTFNFLNKIIPVRIKE